MPQKKYRVTAKDRMSDKWTQQDFDTADEAQVWADQRAFVLTHDGDDVQEMEVSDR